MSKGETIIGATFPVPKPLLRRIFEEGKDVFVKPATLTRLKPGMKIIFYASREDQGFYGEAEIGEVEFFESPAKILEKYGDRIFLTEKEFKEYVKTSERWKTKGKRQRPWMAIVLRNVKKYPKVVKPKRFIAVSGRYVKEKEYQEIQSQF
ncbi:MAG: hypothetical protein PWQ32_645 [Thermococcaceae archaeon]|nr:hypothetical protein [Thermococcaceae archaeon]MDK2982778.1 hypothetical protein [Thermococcaceae archaeon]